MPVKRTPQATMTDVKNKIGDVFDLADKHGKVLITSYNRPRYVIVKLGEDTSLTEIATPIPVVAPATPKEVAPQSEPNPQPEPFVVKPEATPIPIPAPAPAPAMDPPSLPENKYPQIARPVDDTKAPKLAQADTRELEWVEKAKNLL